MDCDYPDCANPAAFHCECHGEGISEARDLCAKHKESAEGICALFGWVLTVKPIAQS